MLIDHVKTVINDVGATATALAGVLAKIEPANFDEYRGAHFLVEADRVKADLLKLQQSVSDCAKKWPV
jgi:hypothetical protein